jgi:hypothetical protein
LEHGLAKRPHQEQPPHTMDPDQAAPPITLARAEPTLTRAEAASAERPHDTTRRRSLSMWTGVLGTGGKPTPTEE